MRFKKISYIERVKRTKGGNNEGELLVMSSSPFLCVYYFSYEEDNNKN